MCRLGRRNVFFFFLFFLQDRHIFLFYIIFCLVIFVKYDMELHFGSVSHWHPLIKPTYVSNESLDKFVRIRHIGEDKSKVVLRCPQQVRAEHDGERFRCHVVLLFIVGDSVGENEVGAQCRQEEKRNILVEMFSNALQQIKVGTWQRVNNTSNARQPCMGIFHLCDGHAESDRERGQKEQTY